MRATCGSAERDWHTMSTLSLLAIIIIRHSTLQKRLRVAARMRRRKWSTERVQGDQGKLPGCGAPAGHCSGGHFEGNGGLFCLKTALLPYSHLLQASHLLTSQKTKETRPQEIQDTSVQTAEVPASTRCFSAITADLVISCLRAEPPTATSCSARKLPLLPWPV